MELLEPTPSHAVVGGGGPSLDTDLDRALSGGQSPRNGSRPVSLVPSAEMGWELGGPPPSVGSSDAEDFQPMELECFRDAAGVELEEFGQPTTTDP